MANSNTITARLGRRQAYWDPNVPGFTPLNGIGPDGPTEVTVDNTKNPVLYKRVLDAVRLGVLVVPLDENDNGITTKTVATKEPTDDDKKNGDEFPSLDKTAKMIMASLSTEELIAKIETINEVNLLSLMAEAEFRGENKFGKPRDKVKTAIRNQIKILEEPNE